MKELCKLYREGRGVAKDLDRVREWELKILKAENAAARQIQGNKIRQLGYTVKEDNGFSMYLLGTIYTGIAERNRKNATDCREKSFVNGYGMSTNGKTGEVSYSLSYEKPVYIESAGEFLDETRSAEWREKTAKACDLEWQNNAMKAAECFLEAAKCGEGKAIDIIKMMWINGTMPSRWQSLITAEPDDMNWLKKEAEGGNPNAMFRLAFVYEKGLRVKADYSRAVHWWRKAAEAGDKRAKTLIGLLQDRPPWGSLKVTRDIGKLSGYEKAGWKEARALVEYLEDKGLVAPADENTTEEFFITLVDNLRIDSDTGDSEASKILGFMYYCAFGVQKDNTKAYEFFLKAAEAGDSSAMLMVYRFHAGGIGVTKDVLEERRWLQKSVEAGNSDAMTTSEGLGQIITWFPSSLDGIKEFARTNGNNPRLLYYIRRAAERGNSEAMFKYGLFQIHRGEYLEGLEWLFRAKEAGDTWAMVQLGNIQAEGIITNQEMIDKAREKAKSGAFTRGYLGINNDPQMITPEIAKEFGIKENKGVYITGVVESSPAQKAGLKKGDFIIRRNDKDVTDWMSFVNSIAIIEPGTEVMLVVVRDGNEKEINVKIGSLEERPVSYDLNAAVDLARAYANAKKYDKAIKLLEDKSKIAKGAALHRIQAVLAAVLYDSGRKQQAIDKFNALYDVQPDDPTVLLVHVDVLIRDAAWPQLTDLAVGWCTKNPDKTTVIGSIIKGMVSSKDSASAKAAEDLLRKIIEANPECLDAVESLALLMHMNGSFTEAIQLYRKVIDLDPERLIAVNNLAWHLCEVENKPHEAKAIADAGLALNPNYVDLIDTRGMIRFRLNDFAGAAADFQKCIELYTEKAPGRSGSHFHLAKALIKLGLEPEALIHLKEAIKPVDLPPAHLFEAEKLLKELMP